MITQLCIENFKSFGSDTNTLHLKPLNFIVGANASGKTNLISALRFLKLAITQDLETAVGEFKGPFAVAHRGNGKNENSIEMRISELFR